MPTAEITATASAPAARTSGTRATVTPPMATSGTRTCARTRRSASRPTSSKLGLDTVGKIEPRAT